MTRPSPYLIRRVEQTFKEIGERYGIVARHVRHDDRRAIELFLPWAYVGKPGPWSQPEAGSVLAVAMGHNDADAGEEEALKLRWPERRDVWSARPAEKTPSPWAALVLGPALGEAQ